MLTKLLKVTRIGNRKKRLVVALFDFFRKYEDSQQGVPPLSELEAFFDLDFHVTSNGISVCKNLQDYQAHFANIKKNFNQVKCSSFIDEPLISSNKVVIRYNASVTDKLGHKVKFQVIAILTIQHGKIVDWVEVLHQTKAIHWDDNP